MDLTSYKLQTAYKVLLSTLEEIDSRSDENSSEDFSETIMQNLNEVYKQIDTARSFTEFSSLLVAKLQHEQSKRQFIQEKDFISENKNALPIVLDSEPQIVDEVFEEYIKEEYLKPLYEDGDESFVQNYKFDKLLAKNFMSELKDALLDKHKSMSERESKALQRMYKNVTQEISFKQGDNLSEKINIIPPPPPLPLNFSEKNVVYSFSKENEKIDLRQENEKDLEKEKEDSMRLSMPIFYENDSQNDEKIDVQRFPIIQCNTKFPLFLKVSEETFIGSGENSDEELIVSELEIDEK